VDLGDRAIDAPARPHFAPMQDKTPLNIGKFDHFSFSEMTELPSAVNSE
jgi:hypothetical protein